jgi:hypothetical protein
VPSKNNGELERIRVSISHFFLRIAYLCKKMSNKSQELCVYYSIKEVCVGVCVCCLTEASAGMAAFKVFVGRNADGKSDALKA